MPGIIDPIIPPTYCPDRTQFADPNGRVQSLATELEDLLVNEVLEYVPRNPAHLQRFGTTKYIDVTHVMQREELDVVRLAALVLTEKTGREHALYRHQDQFFLLRVAATGGVIPFLDQVFHTHPNMAGQSGSDWSGVEHDPDGAAAVVYPNGTCEEYFSMWYRVPEGANTPRPYRRAERYALVSDEDVFVPSDDSATAPDRP